MLKILPLSGRNVSSERSEARRKLRECTGLVDSLMYVVQSQINRKDVDNKVPVHFSFDRFSRPALYFCLHFDLLFLPCSWWRTVSAS